MNIFKRILLTIILSTSWMVSAAMAADEVCYAYDELNRLTSVIYCGDRVVNYSYDAAGNRTFHSVDSYGACDTDDIDQVETSYASFVILPIAGFQVMPITAVSPAFDGTTAYGKCVLTIDTGIAAGISVPEGVFNETITYSSGAPLNLRTLANGAPYNYDGVSDAIFEVTIDQSIAGSQSVTAIETGSWPESAAVTLLLTINSGVTIQGGGGDGGDGGDYGTSGGSSGDDGGQGINMNVDLTLVNNGTINGGSGGGGGGGGWESMGNEYGGAGGGGGWPNGLGGDGGSGYSGNGVDGSDATSGGGGAGGTGSKPGGDGGDNPPEDGGGGAGSPGNAPGSGGIKGEGIKKNGYTLTISGSGSNSGQGS